MRDHLQFFIDGRWVDPAGAPLDLCAPFGGFKRSGNGREWGEHAFGEFLETKAIAGFGSA